MTVTRLVLLFTVPIFVSCVTRDQARPPDDERDQLDGDEESDGEWRTVVDEHAPLPTFVLSERPRAAVAEPRVLERAPAIARELLVSRRDLFGPAMTENALELLAVTADPLGGARVRFAVRVDGLRVEGGDAVVVLGPDGDIRATAGWFPRTARLAAYPSIDGHEAEWLAEEIGTVRWPDDVTELEGPAQLVALPVGDELRPCWRVVITAEGTDGVFRRELYVDARRGTLAYERDGLQTVGGVAGSGIGADGKRRPLQVARRPDASGFRLEDPTRGIRTSTAGGRWSVVGAMLTSDSVDRWDEGVAGAGAAVDAHAYAAATLDFLRQGLGRDSIDGKGGTVQLVVHHGQHLANAFWDGRRAVFGDGDGQTLPFSGAADVVAHELFHGVVQDAAGLVYELQPGALSESLSDIFGSLVEGQNWLVGEHLGRPIRDLEAPWTLDQPAHLSELIVAPVTPDGDMGAVHANSTIPSHAAFLVAEGGTHPRSHVSVHGIGIESLRKVWWRAVTVYLAPRASFRDFAQATRASAEDLFGQRSRELASVTAAWRAVGVLR